MNGYPPRNTGTTRPFRLWNPQAEKFERGRYYSDERRSHNGALMLVRWEQTGASLEVVDVRVNMWRGTYTRRLEFIRIETLRKVIREQSGDTADEAQR